MVALVCCGVPVLTAAAGVFAAERNGKQPLVHCRRSPCRRSPCRGALLLRAQRRGSPGTDCCARSRPGASLSAGSTQHLIHRRSRSGPGSPGPVFLRMRGHRDDGCFGSGLSDRNACHGESMRVCDAANLSGVFHWFRPRCGTEAAVAAGLQAGVALSAGFATVFVTVGLLAAVGLRSVASALPGRRR